MESNGMEQVAPGTSDPLKILKDLLLTRCVASRKGVLAMKESTHVIEDDVPLPGVRGGGPRTELGFLLNSMTPGQSFLTRTNRATVYSLARYYGIPVSVRAEGDQMRVWRISETEKQEQKGEQQ
jgi:hypothetical protein